MKFCFNLPRNSAEGEEQHVVRVVPLVPGSDGSDPVAALHRDRLHGLVHPGVGDADDLKVFERVFGLKSKYNSQFWVEGFYYKDKS